MAENKDTLTLFVNGEKKEVSLKELSPDGEISFAEIVRLAFDSPTPDQLSMFTVSYVNGAGRPTEGILYEGESVKVKDGTEFDVAHTDKS